MPRSSILLLLLLSGCGALPPRPGPPVAAGASLVFASARQLQREGDAAAALAAAEEALRLAPRWIAPRRLLDDGAREALLVPEALAAHRARLAADPNDVVALYLAGRLEGLPGNRRLRRAASLAPREGWVWHGLGWNAYRRGDLDAARRHGRRASALARDPYERAYFAWARSRYELESGHEARAVDLLLARLADSDTQATDRTWLAVALARLELEWGTRSGAGAARTAPCT